MDMNGYAGSSSEAALEPLAARYHRLFELAGDGILLIQDDLIIDCNARAAEILGYDKPEELLKQHAYDISPEKQPDGSNSKEYSATLCQYAYQVPLLFEWVHLTKQGEAKDLEISLTLFDQEKQILLVLWRDISQRKKTERHLLNTRKLLERTGKLAKVGGWELSADKKRIKISEQLASILGLQSCSHLSPKQLLNRIDPQDRRTFGFYIRQLIQTGAAEDLDIRVQHSNGQQLWLRVSSERLPQNETVLLAGAVQDVTEVVEAQQAKKRKDEEIRQGHLQLMQAMSQALEKRDPYTAGHQNRVAELATKIAEKMQLSDFQIEGLLLGATLHDLGKIAIPAEILTRPGRLCQEEMDLIKRHPQIGYDILKEISFPWPIADMVHQHHERYDGSGYPQGLKDKQIALEAQIIAVADVVEAMAGQRPYRAARGIDPALEELRQGKGQRYHPDVVDACLAVFAQGYQL